MFFDILGDMVFQIADDVAEFKKECELSIVDIIDDIPNIPGKIIESLIDTAEEFGENPETVVILALATVGVTLMVGRVIVKIPFPPIIEKKLVAPAIAVLIVRAIAMAAERRLEHVDDQSITC